MDLSFLSHFLSSSNPTLNLLLVMALVWTTGVLCRLINQPPVLGELMAGIIFGPAVLGIIVPNEMIAVLSELGVFFLMFYAGLETNPMELKRYNKLSICVGIFGFIIPFGVSMIACKFLKLDMLTSLFISLGLSITAIAVSARVLHDLHLTRQRVTPVIIGASIIDDVLSLSFFTAIIDIASNGGTISLINFCITISKVLVFFGISIAVGVFLYPKIGKYFATRESKGFTFALITALVFGLMAELAGLHIIIGAYMAGLFVREGVVSKALMRKIDDRFVSITYGFVGPVFFVSLSFHVTFSIFQDQWILVLVLLTAAIIGKVIGAGAGALVGKMNLKESTVIGLAMNGRGAVELVVASIGLQYGIINDAIFSTLVFIAFITTILPPLTIKIFLKKINNDLGVEPLDDVVKI